MAKAQAAGAYRDAGQYDKADHMIKDAYTIVAMEFGEENVTISAILNSQGLLYKKQQKWERALDSYARALAIREKTMGEDHPDSCAARHNIGQLYTDWGRPE